MSKRRPRPGPFSPRVWGAWLVVAAAWLVARLPLAWLLGLGQGVGLAGYRLARHRRHVTEVNLALCFPDLPPRERARLARESFRHAGVSLAEMVRVWLAPRRSLAARFEIHGVEHLERARAAGRGVILLAGHFSCIDVASGPVSALTPMDVIYRENKNPVWEWLQVHGRRHYFDHVIEREDTRRMLRNLRAGHVVWYAADQDYGRRHSVFAPFFGRQAATITATARLARFNGSPVLLISQHRDLASRTWEVRFHPPLEDFPTGDDAADAARVNAVIEAAVRRHPEQYLWAHRRFKTRPPGEPDPYRSTGD
ncbi:MAG: lipid A biosynthesis lauroyl acyltransferase [Gammaproteobacteria bacterium]|nr:lipid A biosynthesis lauroyl acyltransferase [Gammaproteobacteria bacterium]MBK80617.1 lipid A biosynthesis lauroyl acyltransferase [Gammaproteobacteria bacterium]